MRNKFRPERTGVGSPLGELEQAIMQYIWESGDQGCFGAEVLRALNANGHVALTTVLTTLDRLHEKGIVRRNREGKAYRYFAAMAQEELEQRIVEDILDRVIARFPQAVATYFAQAGEEASDLSDLARQIEALQRQQNSPLKEDKGA